MTSNVNSAGTSGNVFQLYGVTDSVAILEDVHARLLARGYLEPELAPDFVTATGRAFTRAIADEASFGIVPEAVMAGIEMAVQRLTHDLLGRESAPAYAGYLADFYDVTCESFTLAAQNGLAIYPTIQVNRDPGGGGRSTRL